MSNGGGINYFALPKIIWGQVKKFMDEKVASILNGGLFLKKKNDVFKNIYPLNVSKIFILFLSDFLIY